MHHSTRTFSLSLVVIGCAVMLSWLWPVTRVYWNHLDHVSFFITNGFIAENTAAQFFWAIANHRAFDLVSASIFCAIYMHFMYKNRREIDPLYTITHGFFMLIFAIIVVQTMHLLFPDGRLSPTLVLDPHYKLTELVPSIAAKDASSRSFPGDHATVLLLFAMCMHAFCGRSYRWIYVLVVLFSLPRLVSGAHWLTDIVVGGGASVLIAVPLMLHFGGRERFNAAVYPRFQRVYQSLRRA